MKHRRPRRHPAVLFANICYYHFRLPLLVALRWWEAMAESEDPQVHRVKRKLDGYHGRIEAFVAWGWRELQPKVLMRTVEGLVYDGPTRGNVRRTAIRA